MAWNEFNFDEVLVDVCFIADVPPDNPLEDELGVPYDPPPLPLDTEIWDRREDQTTPGGMPVWWNDPPPAYHWPTLTANKIVGITISPGLVEKAGWKVYHSDNSVHMTGDLTIYFQKQIEYLTADGTAHTQLTGPIDTPNNAKYLYKFKAPDTFIANENITIHYERGNAEDIPIYVHYDSVPQNNALLRVIARETI